ncbi:trypsin-like serine peptidase [Photobacterium sp. R1]
MNRKLIVLALAGICISGANANANANANELTHFVEMDEKATFIEGENVVQVPAADAYFQPREYSIAEKAAAMSAVAVSADGTQYKAEISEETLALLESAVKTMQAQGLDASIFTTEPHEPTKPVLPDDTFSTLKVIGADNRVRVTNTTSAPHSYNGRIDVGCTGTLITKKHVLTAGHCVSNGSGTWYKSLNFTAGQNGSYKPWGTATWKNAVTTTAWHNNGDTNYDYAIIVLNSEPNGGNSGWGTYSGGTHSVTGYPGDKPFGTMWTDSGSTDAISSRRVCYTLDTAGGQSGSGIKDSNNYVRGVHTTGSSTRNCGTQITSTVYNTLKDWIAKNP